MLVLNFCRMGLVYTLIVKIAYPMAHGTPITPYVHVYHTQGPREWILSIHMQNLGKIYFSSEITDFGRICL